MKQLIERADVSKFFAKELELIQNGQSFSESISSFQSWLCNYLSLIEDPSERQIFLHQITEELEEIHLVHKYRNIYGQTDLCNDTCMQLSQKLKDYLNVKYGVQAA
jgi:hypothetical protein